MANTDYLVAAALHIGENYSSYACSFVDQFKRNPLKVSIPTWTNRNELLVEKTLTCVLFTKDKKFRAFGFDAENTYNELANDGTQENHYYFRKFMRKIFNETKVKSEFLLDDGMGKTISAIDVLSACIKYLCDHLANGMRSFRSGLSTSKIRWILTIPAARNEPYQQFLRSAALKAGIEDEHLVIVSEPVAASLYCHYHLLMDSESADKSFLFVPKAKYLVLDAGADDDIDITVHELQENKSIKQMFNVRYEDCGGNSVNKAFIDLLTDMFGKDVMDKFQIEYMEDYSDMLQQMEKKKRSINNEMSGKVTINIPCKLLEDFEQINRRKFSEHIMTKPQYKGHVTFCTDTLRMDADILKNIIKETCEFIIRHLKNTFRKDFFKDVSSILMVGGFSESPILQSLIKETFPDKRIVTSKYQEFAVLRGAVAFGHSPVDFDIATGLVPTRFSEK